MATTWQELLDDERIPVNYLAEVEPCVVLDDWTVAFDTIYSSPFMPEFPQGIVSRIYVDGVLLTAQASKAALTSASGWFHAVDEGLLYVRLADDGDPAEATTQVYFWMYFAKNEVWLWAISTVFMYYEPLLKSIPGIGRSARDIMFAAEEISGGSITLKNGAGKDYGDFGPFDNIFHDYIWNNKTIKIKAGGSLLPYAEYVTVFVGRLSKPGMSDTEVKFTLQSMLSILDKKIPVETYTAVSGSTVPHASYYEHLEPNAEGRPIPLLMGICLNVRPTQINTQDWTFRLGRRFKKILRIRAGGVQIYEDGDHIGDPGDIVADITPEYGRFTMHLWASAHQLTADVEGETAEDEITVLSTYGKQARFLMENTYAGDIDSSLIDTAAFDAMDTSCPQAMGFVVGEVKKINDYLNVMDESVCAQHGVDESGKITARVWAADLDTVNAIEFDATDIHDLTFDLEDSKLYQKVKLGYAKNNCVQADTHSDSLTAPAAVQEDWSHDYLYVEDEDANTKILYDNEEVLPVNTVLSSRSDALVTLARYMALVTRPWIVAPFSVHLRAFDLKTGDTVHLTHYRLPTGDSGYFKVIGVTANRDLNKAEIKAFRIKT